MQLGLRFPLHLSSSFLIFSSLLLTFFFTSPARAQSSSSVLVDLIAIDKHTNAPAPGITQNDLQILVDRRLAPISSFAHAPESPVRPISMWFVVLCPEHTERSNWASNGSGFIQKKTSLFTPVLRQLNASDTVGVGHWCDDGSLAVDLFPTPEREAPSTALEAVLSKNSTPVGTTKGTDALHALGARLVETSQAANVNSLPALVFLYGDHSGMYVDEINDMLDKLFSASAIVYGINNGVVHYQSTPIIYQQNQPYVVHFLSDKTGGQVLSTVRGAYGEELDRIRVELQGRYQIGIDPRVLDGKRHELEIKFTREARKKFSSVDLRFASGFMATGRSQESAIAAVPEVSPELTQALHAAKFFKEIPFDASGKVPAPGQAAQFRLFVDASSLAWTPGEDGTRQCKLNLAVAGISSSGAILADDVKNFEPQQSKADSSAASPKAVVLGVSYSIPPGAVRVRFVLRDPASGHIGSFELPVARIGDANPHASVSQPATP